MPRSKRDIPIEHLTAATLEEIARELGVSAMRACQIEAIALKKLEREFVKRKIVTEKGRYNLRSNL